MTKDEILAKIREVLVQEFELDPAAVTPEAQLYTDLDLDSIDAVDLIVRMKQYVQGKIDPELFKQARTIQDVVDVLFPLVHSQAL
ncbi:acyl carrier protein [Spirochaetia bacterium]|nr:acyl carrier protein [Spirochaetia bacterium]